MQRTASKVLKWIVSDRVPRATCDPAQLWQMEIRWTNRRTEVVEALLSRCPRAVRICIVGSRSHIPSKNILGLHREFILQSDVSQQFNLDRTVVLSITRVESDCFSPMVFPHRLPRTAGGTAPAFLGRLAPFLEKRCAATSFCFYRLNLALPHKLGTGNREQESVGHRRHLLQNSKVRGCFHSAKQRLDRVVWQRIRGNWSFPSPISTQGLLQLAFGVDHDRILGTPAWTNWINTNQYDIEAKVGDTDESRWKTLPRDEQRQALIPILEDRFKLRFHHETKDVPVLVLAVAKNGPKLKAVPLAKPIQMSKKDRMPGARGKTDAGERCSKSSRMSIPELISMLSEQFPAALSLTRPGLQANTTSTSSGLLWDHRFCRAPAPIILRTPSHRLIPGHRFSLRFKSSSG